MEERRELEAVRREFDGGYVFMEMRGGPCVSVVSDFIIRMSGE